MHDHELNDEFERRSIFPRVLIGVGLAAVLFAVLVRSQQVPLPIDATAPAELENLGPAPNLVVEGWLNGTAPTPGDLEGNVVVIEAFATWCGPCRQIMPHMVELEEKFRDKGVVFLSMTTETADDIGKLEAFADEFGMTWPIAYGADDVLIALEAHSIPAAYVISREGRLVWTHRRPGGLEDAIEKALVFTSASEAPRSLPAETKHTPAEL